MTTPYFDPDLCRSHFPALNRSIDGSPAVYFDGPAGSQVPEMVVAAISNYLLYSNANIGGAFETSVETSQIIHRAQQSLADLIGVEDKNCIVFGANMTSLTLSLSRALSKEWQPGDEIIVTDLDHDANITPWTLAAKDAGATIHHLGIHNQDCTLNLDQLSELLTPRTKLVAVAAASNGTGTVNPIKEITSRAHQVGAQVFVDAVHFAPHRLMHFDMWDIDFLACSTYKFFGPHLGVLCGKRNLLERLPVYRVRPSPETVPDRWMTGTQSYEAIAGAHAAVSYLAALGQRLVPESQTRRECLSNAYAGISNHEQTLVKELLERLMAIPEVQIYGVTSPDAMHMRLPTVLFTHRNIEASAIASFLAAHGVFVWSGHHYALRLAEKLSLLPQGAVRVGLLHYNTAQEVHRFADLLTNMA